MVKLKQSQPERLIAGTGKFGRLVHCLEFAYPVDSDFKTSRHYPAGLFPNILPAFSLNDKGTSGVAIGFGT